MSPPIVTIGVCVKDRGHTLSEAIESIMHQDFPHTMMEVIFVDDGSRDSTLSVIQEYVSRIDIATKIFHTEWQGLGLARNIVVKNAKGKYIVWVDGDMRLPNDHVKKQVDFMEKNPDVGIAKAKYGMFFGKTVATLENMSDVVEETLGKIYWKKHSKLPGSGGSIYRVEAIKQVGGFDAGIKRVGEDQDIAYRVRSAGWSLSRTQAVFHEGRETTWKALWDKYFWYGYGNYKIYCKNRNIFSLPRMVPPASLIIGLFYSTIAYKLTHKKIFFLLPFHFTLKTLSWCAGFITNQANLA